MTQFMSVKPRFRGHLGRQILAALILTVLLVGTSIVFIRQGVIDSLLLPYDLGTRLIVLVYPLVITAIVAPVIQSQYANGFVRYFATRLDSSTFLRGTFVKGVTAAALPFGFAFMGLYIFSFYVEPNIRIGHYEGVDTAMMFSQALNHAQFATVLQTSPVMYGIIIFLWHASWAGLWAMVAMLSFIHISNQLLALAVPALTYLFDLFAFQLFSFLEPISSTVAIFPQLTSAQEEWRPFISLVLFTLGVGLLTWRTFKRGFQLS